MVYVFLEDELCLLFHPKTLIAYKSYELEIYSYILNFMFTLLKLSATSTLL